MHVCRGQSLVKSGANMATVEAAVIQRFIPILIKTVSDCVQPVSDQCFSKGLIPNSVYKRVLESRGTSEDKARTLILAVKKSFETDSNCLEIFLSALNEELSFVSGGKLLSEIRDEVLNQKKGELEAPDGGPTQRAVAGTVCQAIVPISGHSSSSLVPNGVLENQEFLSQQKSLITKLEDAIRKHEQTHLEKAHLEEKLKDLSEESKRLKDNLSSLSSQIHDVAQANSEKITEQNSRISDCEKEMVELKEKLATLEPTVEECNMYLRRSKTMMTIGGEKLVKHVIERCQEQIRKEYTMALQEKEMAHREAEDKIERRAQEKIRVSELQHQVVLQAKDIRIKDLQLELNKKSPLKRSNTYNSGQYKFSL